MQRSSFVASRRVASLLMEPSALSALQGHAALPVPASLTLRSSGHPPGYRCLPLNSNVRLARMQHTQVLAGSSKFGGPRSVSTGGLESLPRTVAHRRVLCGCVGSARSLAASGSSSSRGALVLRRKPSGSIAPHGTVGALGFARPRCIASAGEPNPSFKRTCLRHAA